MAYSENQDLINAITEATLIQLTDDTDSGVVNATYVADAITRADSITNAYLRAQHTVPLSTTPDLINQISVDLSLYLLYKRRRDTFASSLDEGMELRYKQSMSLLKDINAQKIQIDDSTSFANTSGVYTTNKATSDEIYTSTVLGKF